MPMTWCVNGSPQRGSVSRTSQCNLGFLSYLIPLTLILGRFLQPPAPFTKPWPLFSLIWAWWLYIEAVFIIWWNMEKKVVHFGTRNQGASLDQISSSCFWVIGGKKFITQHFFFLIRLWAHFGCFDPILDCSWSLRSSRTWCGSLLVLNCEIVRKWS